MVQTMECPNCGSSLVGRYCAECGQATPSDDDYSLRAHVADFFEHLTSLDGKVARTVWTLVRSPGLLTADHLAGRRVRYVRPLQLFLLVNVLLFFAAPRVPLFSYSLANYLKFAPPSPALVRSLVASATSGGDPAAAAVYARAFDDRVEAERKSLILLFVPALAIVLRVIFWRRGRDTPDEALARIPRRYGEHLVFALHVLAFVWLLLVGWGAIAAALAGRSFQGVTGWILWVLLASYLLVVPAYFFAASRRVYLLSRTRVLALTLAVGVAFFGLLLAYRALLFFTTYYTL
jgi:hypothetical protein